jgi:hypothetical protein
MVYTDQRELFGKWCIVYKIYYKYNSNPTYYYVGCLQTHNYYIYMVCLYIFMRIILLNIKFHVKR